MIKMMVLSNPRLAAVIVMVAICAISFFASFFLLRLHESKRIKKNIDAMSNAALSARDDTIVMLEKDISNKEERIMHLEAKIGRITTFLSKAIEESGGRS